MINGQEFNGIPTGNVCDANNKSGNMKSYIRPVYPTAAVAGPAFTVKSSSRDNLTIHIAIQEAPAGSVLVVDAGGYTEAGHFGEIMASACQAKGILGLIIDGGCRDASDLEEMDFPVFSRSVNPGGTVKDSIGEIGCPISCGGVLISTGDIVVADRDGVVVVEQENAENVFRKAKGIVAHEIKVKKELSEGKTTLEIYRFSKIDSIK